MLVNEHLSKAMFAKAGIPTPRGEIVRPGELADYAPSFPGPWFVKSQVLAGGRGKAGGVRRARDHKELMEAATEILELPVKGELPPYVRVEPGAEILGERYLSFAVSRSREALMLTVKRSGGVEVESGSGGLKVQEVDPESGPAQHQVRTAFFALSLGKEYFPAFNALIAKLFAMVRDNGLLLAEVNPLGVLPGGEFLALDGKVEVDDNVADFRPDLADYREPAHMTPEERTAIEAGLSFVPLKGRVGLMANGAGLAMATMDLVNFSGLPAANFLDLGGAADRERMRRAFGLLFGDPAVECVFVNLFGGILSCEEVALAMADVLGGAPPAKPMVVRLAGNGSAAGREILDKLNFDSIRLAEDMTHAIILLAELTAPDEERPLAATPEAMPRSGRATMPVCCLPPLSLGVESRVIVQGATGKVAGRHIRLMQRYGTNLVAGVTPFKGGQEVEGLPVYDTVAEAADKQGADVSIVFVPGRAAADAVLEAADAGVPWIICITEGVPQQDMLRVLPKLRGSGSRLIGPNTPGVMIPGEAKLGILPAGPFKRGPVALLSRSGTLTYEVAHRLSEKEIGQRFCVGIGGDPFVGERFTDFLDMTREDDQVEAVVVLGEIGGRAEEELARHVRDTAYPKPVVAFVAGRTAPPGKRLGHAGAILEESVGGVDDKIGSLARAGVTVCPDLSLVAEMTARALGRGW